MTVQFKKEALQCELFSGHKEKIHIYFSPATSARQRHTYLSVDQIWIDPTNPDTAHELWSHLNPITFPSHQPQSHGSDDVRDVVFQCVDKEPRGTNIPKVRISNIHLTLKLD